MSLIGRFVFQCLTALQSNKIIHDDFVFVQKVHYSRVGFHNELLIQKSCLVLLYFWLFRRRTRLLSWKFTDAQWFHADYVLGNLSTNVKRLFFPFKSRESSSNKCYECETLLYNSHFFLSTKYSPMHRIYQSDNCLLDHLLEISIQIF